jgi:hypothetical protein
MNSEIYDLLERNKLDDLTRFLKRRKCLNETNIYLIYLFHLVQCSGIILTAYATGTNNINLIWAGISLNMTASLINVYEKTNNTLSKKLLHNIKSIKDGTYIDETPLVETENTTPLTKVDITSKNADVVSLNSGYQSIGK